jgi:hypothetical protein
MPSYIPLQYADEQMFGSRPGISSLYPMPSAMTILTSRTCDAQSIGMTPRFQHCAG